MKTYKKHFGLFRNKAVREEIKGLDPVTDHCRIVYLTAGYEFPWDSVRSLEVALMRTFCSPSVSTLLHRTGEFRRHGQKRYDDTALLVAEFMQHGYDSEAGKRAINHMNRIHGVYTIANEDFLFVLSTFIFLPIEWMERYGWRKLMENEKQALFYFFREVGLRMKLHDIPDSLDAFGQFVRDYENRHFVYAETNKQVGNATVNIVKGWMPFFAKPFVLPVMKCLLDEKMLNALGYSKPPRWLKALVLFSMKLRALALRKITFKKYPSFVTTETNRTYPKGYVIEELGPASLVAKQKKVDEHEAKKSSQ